MASMRDKDKDKIEWGMSSSIFNKEKKKEQETSL